MYEAYILGQRPRSRHDSIIAGAETLSTVAYTCMMIRCEKSNNSRRSNEELIQNLTRLPTNHNAQVIAERPTSIHHYYLIVHARAVTTGDYSSDSDFPDLLPP